MTPERKTELRELLALHAPQPPPDWFVPLWNAKDYPPKPAGELCETCKGDYGDCVTPEICRAIDKWRDAKQAVSNQNLVSRQCAVVAQWPWHYADMVLDAR